LHSSFLITNTSYHMDQYSILLCESLGTADSKQLDELEH
jgi:hypothetical protein